MFAEVLYSTIINVQGGIITTEFFYGKYQRVEYIQSTGSQYITTSIIPSNTKGFHIKISSQDISNDLIYVGSRNGTDTRLWSGNVSNYIYVGWNSNDQYQNISTNTQYTIENNYLNSRTKVVNGTTIASGLGTLSSSNTYPIYIFAGNQRGEVLTPSKIKLYELRFSDGSSITHNFIPVYRKQDGVIGLLEEYSKTFYTNSGSGTFSKGSNVSR